MVVKQSGDIGRSGCESEFYSKCKISKGDFSRDVTFFFKDHTMYCKENGLMYLSFNTAVLPGKQNSLTSTV